MDRVANMGMPLDMAQRRSLARIDDATRRSRVADTREAIYSNNFAVDGVAVESLLKEDSLVPTAVIIPFFLKKIPPVGLHLLS